ncbi:quinol:cytochrome c oxidoreductase iron-sulfur protein precursor [Polaribacter sp. KT25b]|uniref:TAT-variant-translocated molybdopterin oxidoreductase n=1 Tax=Polaribacter sp. KT25b TaxID=1855336 RepID=UPI00087C9518|nr:TAT-variant-translocated molybdopterin oxidoreductase [Polaribacter sp. KT25b]SDS43786.1 quinol:cytochrome c oxidoreductase iron-sulfur protein precursor [Polaribacter sp. KT25b]
MASNKKYWKSVEELKGSSIVETLSKNEFVEEIPSDEFLGDKETLESSSTSRRDFLKYVGFTTAAASLAACEGPVRKSIPFVVKPNDVTPGIADWYATSMADGYDFANVLVKTREGRPIQIMPNKDANGTTSARVQAAVLSLYDEKLRLKEPTKGGEVISWADADREILAKLNAFKEANKSVVLLTGTMASPSTSKIVDEFNVAYPNVKHVVYDAVSESGAADAMLSMYGKRVLPNYHLDKAKTIVSFGADFLGDFHGGFEKQFIAGRKPETGHMSYHVQIESNMSLTGANSDKRIVVKPSDQVFALLNLYKAITGDTISSKTTAIDDTVKKLASELKKAGSKGVVLTGLNDENAQLIAFAINKAIGSEIFDAVNTLNIRQGNDTEVAQLVSDMKAGKIAGLISYNVDPIYSLSNSSDFSQGLKKLELSVALSIENNETVNASNYALPTPHFLESWGDTQFNSVTYGLVQPTIQPLFNTRQIQDTLLSWSGNTTKYYDYLKAFATANVLNGSSWNTALHNGFYNIETLEDIQSLESTVVISDVASQLSNSAKKATGFELNLYTKTGLGDGKQANNPWLQEFPDPITRASWDNYLMMSIADARELGFSNPVKDNGAIDGDYAKVSVNGVEVVVPVMVQPGQAKGSVGLALGYGRTFGLKEEMQVGVNGYPLYTKGNNIQYGVKIDKVSGTHQFACTQVQKTIAGRHDILKVASLKEYNTVAPKDHHHGWNKPSMVSYDHQEVEANTIDLWDEHNREVGHHFNLSIDLTSCTGCGACVVACHAENNVPVVGKNEVRVGRDMHWLRIDRYYSSEVETREEAKELGLSRGEMYEALETEAENPEVTFQPMMCQHCNHAPCETVCPVAATSHGRQGQNQMAYNRCVGTRYCANNCPYRVRRFNWFNYADNNEFDFNMNNEYGKMVLNPDVVVRSRGVMEKCSMCIQMTQATILKAKKEGRAVDTDEFETACSSACTTGAMVFGDLNNKKDNVAALAIDKRAYNVLDYLQTKPNVIYQVKVKNTNEA